MAGGGDSKRAIIFALGANFAIAVAKGVAAMFAGSSAMLAETVPSLADCANQGLPELQAQISRFYAGRPVIDRVISLITLQLGNDVLVSVQASLKQAGDVGVLLAEIDAMEQALKAGFPVVRWSFFEPEAVG